MTLPDPKRWRVRDRLESLSLPAILLIGGIVFAGVGTAGYYAYETYDYVQHDNDFCVSCHLMEEPFERFAQSAHRGLGCKACHRPSMIERSTMGLTQIVDNPDSLGIHAQVPNSACADCHINGDPEKWEQVAGSAGHRLHLESADTALQGLRCVECHSTSVHEFASVDRTCAQSSCHTESAVQLGAMSNLTIHCVACHGFSAPAPGDEPTETFSAALAPDRETCLSCHEMRVLVSLPDPDPHEGTCASCHNPHTQTTPAEAAASCAGCHDDDVAVNPHHEGLEEPIAGDCLYCHQAHDFALDGDDCLSCHVDILEDDPGVPRRGRAGPGAIGGAALSGPALGPRFGAVALHTDWDAMNSWNGPIQERSAQANRTFRHSQHPDFACTACHTSENRHGEVAVTAPQGCRDCHHTAPATDDCAACHATAQAPGDPYTMSQTFELPVTGAVRRPLPFDHAVHTSEGCASCHTEGLALSASTVDCASCHEEHHEPETSCVSCHEQPSVEVHPIAQAHVTCSGAGCHTDDLFPVIPRTRQACLGCHQDMADHRPEQQDCAECHALSEPADGAQ